VARSAAGLWQNFNLSGLIWATAIDQIVRVAVSVGHTGRPKVLLFALAAVIAYSVGNSVAANADSGLFMRRVQIAFCAQSVAIMGLTSARYI